LPKTHWLDAACVGASTPAVLQVEGVRPLRIRATGFGKRNRCWTDRHGFPIRHAPRAKSFLGFQTGDIVRAAIRGGQYQGLHEGRITIRHRPRFCLGTIDVHPKYLTRIHRADGYAYSLGETFSTKALSEAGNSPVA
jgi:hypothetical protein